MSLCVGAYYVIVKQQCSPVAQIYVNKRAWSILAWIMTCFSLEKSQTTYEVSIFHSTQHIIEHFQNLWYLYTFNSTTS